MPERSSTIPMKVKKGIASSVSFDITPQNRSGSALSNGQDRLIDPPE